MKKSKDIWTLRYRLRWAWANDPFFVVFYGIGVPLFLLFLALWLTGCGGSVTEEPLPQADGGACPEGYTSNYYAGLCVASIPEAECPPAAIYTTLGLCIQVKP